MPKYLESITALAPIFTSVVGSTLLQMSGENLCEYGGYYGGGAIGSHITSRIGAVALRQIGNLTALGVAAAASSGLGAVGSYAVAKSGLVRPEFREPIRYLLMITLSAILFYLLKDVFATTGEMIGKEAGNFIGYFIGAFIGGFLAISLCGSQEKFWDQKDAPNTYLIKSLQCLLMFVMIDRLRSPSDGVGRIILDQMIGSLIYNALAIGTVALMIKNKQLLDNALPNKPDVEAIVSHPEVTATIVHDFYHRLTDLPWIQQFSRLVHYKKGYEKLSKDFEKIKEGILKDPLLDSLMAELKQRAVDFGIGIGADALAATETAQKLRKNLINMGSEEFLLRFIHSFNHCMQQLGSPAIVQLQSQLEQVFWKWQRESNPTVKQRLRTELQLLKNSLQRALVQQLTPHMPLVQTLDQEYQAIASHPLLQLSEKEKQAIEEFTEVAAQHMTKLIQNVEIKLFGFKLTGQGSTAFMKELSDVYFRTMAKFLISQTLTPLIKLSNDEMRSFYINMVTLVCSHYQTLNVPFMGQIKSFAHDQISHAQLS